MKWFKHISDSLDDPFIFDLMDKFGADGYLVFFGILEIYSREFKSELNWNLLVTRSQLRAKFHKRQDTLIMNCLKHIQNSGKWDVGIDDKQVTIFIPKFTQIIDEWTKRKLSSGSVVTPKKHKLNKNKEVRSKNKEKERDMTPLCPQKEIIKLYHEILPSLPMIEVWPEDSKKQLRMRWREDTKRQSLDKWKDFFQYVKKSEFLMGVNDRGWTADLFWLVGPKNFAKVLSGKYHRNQKENIAPYEEFING